MDCHKLGKSLTTSLKFLTPNGYHECPITPGLWKHTIRPIQFCLVVDDFGIKYTNQEDANHLINVPLPTSNPILTPGFTTQAQHSQIQSQNSICQGTRHHSSTQRKRRQKSTGNTRHIVVLCPSHQFDHAARHRHTCHPTVSPHQQNNRRHNATPQLLRLQSQHNRPVSQK